MGCVMSLKRKKSLHFDALCDFSSSDTRFPWSWHRLGASRATSPDVQRHSCCFFERMACLNMNVVLFKNIEEEEEEVVTHCFGFGDVSYTRYAHALLIPQTFRWLFSTFGESSRECLLSHQMEKIQRRYRGDTSLSPSVRIKVFIFWPYSFSPSFSYGNSLGLKLYWKFGIWDNLTQYTNLPLQVAPRSVEFHTAALRSSLLTFRSCWYG